MNWRVVGICFGAQLFALAAGCAGVAGVDTTGLPVADAGPPVADAPAERDAGTLPPTGDGLIFLSPRDDPRDDSLDEVDVSASFRSKATPLVRGGPLNGECRFYAPSDSARAEAYEGDTSAGKLTVRAGSESLGLKWGGTGDGSGAYGAPGPIKGIAPGVPVQIEATGDVVPAFHLTVRLASRLHLLTPVADGIERGAAFNVVWQPTAVKESLLITLVGNGGCVACVANDTTQALFVIPKEYVGLVTDSPAKADDGTPVINLALTTITRETVRVGDFEVNALSNRRAVVALTVR